MDEWVALAKEKLEGYESWSRYCRSFQSKHESLEGTFAIARYCQRQAAKTKPKAEPQAFHTPISSRTRGAVSQVAKGMAGLRLEPPVTPTRKGPRPSHGTPLIPSPTDDMDLDEESSPSPSHMQFISPVKRELGNILYPPTKDEQIVNTALIVFLDALTIHFDLSSQWTLHRKAFTATFEQAEFEARTDGYLDSPRGKPRVLIEVKPVLRSSNLLRI
ncbi:uncharacterized protein PGRI_082770 [Penicillium griseofulvum]|uniref:Uncharacterized protein n=1 Tax=Penicillium patulum TaxID=5078 RepID=A0A135LSP7_PENPA|nr:uncharacterized protein PGRI_082770 [Penicillium griseofulvum]KXG51993.1 hypothetical protein PGRI_082770 [Penicillium griseofulvum]